MCTFPSFWYSSYENVTAAAEELYNFDPSLIPQVEHKEILTQINGDLDGQSGFDNLFDMEFSFSKGIETLHYDRILSPPMELHHAEGLVDNSEMNPRNIKKLSHNANERQRRKKLNALYAQLRALLPNPNARRKLSIPNTIFRVLNYIPEMRSEIEMLRRRRDKLLRVKRNCHRSVVTHKSREIRQHSHEGLTCSPAIVSVNAAAVNRSEVLVTINICRAAFFLSSLFVFIEEEGLHILDASSFVSRNRVCCVLHLQMINGSRLDTEVLREKIYFAM